MPTNFKPGRRYPLVIQAYGFKDNLFLPSGFDTTAFAAQELAASGMIVLQVGGPCPSTMPDEGPCHVSGYEAVVHKLAAQGLVDPNEVGIIGFSRSGFHVMEAITSSSLHIKAASINDATMGTYSEAVLVGSYSLHTSIIGAPPFGMGLQQWLKHAPGFNLDKVTAAVMITAHGQITLLGMWETYSVLHDLHKPVELVMLNMDNGPGTLPYEHVLTNPGFRLTSQGGSVDWFRFWLQGYEDPSPAKAAQYRRWENLRKLQQAE